MLFRSADDGLRLWVRYRQSKLGQWLRRRHVREQGTVGASGDSDALSPSPATASGKKPAARKRLKAEPKGTRLAVERLSAKAAAPGSEVWLLLGGAPGAKGGAGACSAFEVTFGHLSSPATLIAPMLLSCLVPHSAPTDAGPCLLAVSAMRGEGRAAIACPYTFEVLAPRRS